ncbi:MAG: STAS domain-containing protein [Bacteroidetes bacterium]|nr:STAS domain-containing protein [Bacteroidota bacterium]
MKQSKKVQIASETRVKVTSKKITDTLAVLEIEDKLMTDEHIKMIQNGLSELLEDSFRQIVVDLSRIKRINSSGLGSLISLFNMARNKDAELKIGGLNEFVKNVLNITKLTEVFEIHMSQEEAIQSFQSSSSR